MEWVDGNLGSKLTMKYPAVLLMEEGAHGEVLLQRFPDRELSLPAAEIRAGNGDAFAISQVAGKGHVALGVDEDHQQQERGHKEHERIGRIDGREIDDAEQLADEPRTEDAPPPAPATALSSLLATESRRTG